MSYCYIGTSKSLDVQTIEIVSTRFSFDIYDKGGYPGFHHLCHGSLDEWPCNSLLEVRPQIAVLTQRNNHFHGGAYRETKGHKGFEAKAHSFGREALRG